MIEYYNILAAIVKQLLLLLLWHFLAIAAGFYAIDICQALSLLALLDSISS